MPSPILLRGLAWFIPPQGRTDEATLGPRADFAFSHLFGPFWGHAISVYLYFASHQRGFPLGHWTCITAFWMLPFALKLSGRLQTLALLSVTTSRRHALWLVLITAAFRRPSCSGC